MPFEVVECIEIVCLFPSIWS